MTPSRAQPDLSTYKGRFGDHIRALREKRKLTQQEVADAIGKTDVTISNWESGKRFPDAELLPILAKIFQKKVRDLFPE